MRYIPILEKLKCGRNVYISDSSIHIIWPGFENLHIYGNMTSGNSGTLIPETTCTEIKWEAFQIHTPEPHFGSAELESSAVNSR